MNLEKVLMTNLLGKIFKTDHKNQKLTFLARAC